MHIPVVLKDGKERLVNKDELQVLMANRQIMFFERAEGWVVIGRDQDRLRSKTLPFEGDERRQSPVQAKDRWH